MERSRSETRSSLTTSKAGERFNCVIATCLKTSSKTVSPVAFVNSETKSGSRAFESSFGRERYLYKPMPRPLRMISTSTEIIGLRKRDTPLPGSLDVAAAGCRAESLSRLRRCKSVRMSAAC